VEGITITDGSFTVNVEVITLFKASLTDSYRDPSERSDIVFVSVVEPVLQW
jgi:hypothetical protein